MRRTDKAIHYLMATVIILSLSGCVGFKDGAGYVGAILPIEKPVFLNVSPFEKIETVVVTKSTNLTENSTTSERMLCESSIVKNKYSLEKIIKCDTNGMGFEFSTEYSPDGTIVLNHDIKTEGTEDSKDKQDMIQELMAKYENKNLIMNKPLLTGLVIKADMSEAMEDFFKVLKKIDKIELGRIISLGHITVAGRSYYNGRDVIVLNTKNESSFDIVAANNNMRMKLVITGYELYDIETSMLVGSSMETISYIDGDRIAVDKQETSLLSFKK